jgi:hypothetical protein
LAQLLLALDAWQIQDGLYPDFSVGDEARFAVELRLQLLGPSAARAAPLLEPLGNGYHAFAGSLRGDAPAGAWILDMQPPLFSVAPLPRYASPGEWVQGEALLSLDTGAWSEDLRFQEGAPVLGRRWRIDGIQRDTRIWRAGRILENRPIAPGARLERTVAMQPAHREPPSHFAPVACTDGWRDDNGCAHYVLACELLE